MPIRPSVYVVSAALAASLAVAACSGGEAVSSTPPSGRGGHAGSSERGRAGGGAVWTPGRRPQARRSAEATAQPPAEAGRSASALVRRLLVKATGGGEAALWDARRATAALKRGAALPPLFGVPVAIKDVTPTRGLRTTFGSKLFEDHVPEDDAPTEESDSS